MSSGVWAVLNSDQNAVDRVYSEDDELGAGRSVNDQGYWSKIIFLPWGMDVLDAIKKKPEPEAKPKFEIVDNRDPACVEAWPECASFEFDSRCCRFPKNCSAGTTWMRLVEEKTDDGVHDGSDGESPSSGSNDVDASGVRSD